jgi:hypothetical protein
LPILSILPSSFAAADLEDHDCWVGSREEKADAAAIISGLSAAWVASSSCYSLLDLLLYMLKYCLGIEVPRQCKNARRFTSFL